jgi:hypothetical protein
MSGRTTYNLMQAYKKDPLNININKNINKGIQGKRKEIEDFSKFPPSFAWVPLLRTTIQLLLVLGRS